MTATCEFKSDAVVRLRNRTEFRDANAGEKAISWCTRVGARVSTQRSQRNQLKLFSRGEGRRFKSTSRTGERREMLMRGRLRDGGDRTNADDGGW